MGAITGTRNEALNLTEKQDQQRLLLFTALRPVESMLHSQVIRERALFGYSEQTGQTWATGFLK